LADAADISATATVGRISDEVRAALARSHTFLVPGSAIAESASAAFIKGTAVPAAPTIAGIAGESDRVHARSVTPLLPGGARRWSNRRRAARRRGCWRVLLHDAGHQEHES